MSTQTEYLTASALPESILAEIFDSSERAATIVAAAMIDDELKRMLIENLELCDNPQRDPLFNAGETPLQSFNAKIILAQRMKLITPAFASFLHRLRDIRNKYAHFPTFEDTSITDMRDSLTTDYFYGKASERLGTDTTKAKHAPINVAGSYSTPNTPLNRMLERGVSQQEVGFRLLLVTMLGHLSKQDLNVLDAALIAITCTYTAAEGGKLLTSINLHYQT
jgi:hypothetical protein